jgi:hypothetical protein
MQKMCGLHCLTAQSEHKVYDINYGHSLGHWIYTNKVKSSIFDDWDEPVIYFSLPR